jgi:hypothetical protein
MKRSEAIRKWILGPNGTYINLFFIAYCGFAFVAFFWSVAFIRHHGVPFYAVQLAGGFLGGVGVLLFINGKSWLGVVGVACQLGSYLSNHFLFGTSLTKNLFFWIFCVAFVVFGIGALLRGVRRTSSRLKGMTEDKEASDYRKQSLN